MQGRLTADTSQPVDCIILACERSVSSSRAPASRASRSAAAMVRISRGASRCDRGTLRPAVWSKDYWGEKIPQMCRSGLAYCNGCHFPPPSGSPRLSSGVSATGFSAFLQFHTSPDSALGGRGGGGGKVRYCRISTPAQCMLHALEMVQPALLVLASNGTTLTWPSELI